MFENANKDLVSRFYLEIVGGGDLSQVEAFVSLDYVDHNADGKLRGPEVVRTHVQAVRETLSAFTLRISDIVAEGDRVVTRVEGEGKHTGTWWGIPSTGKTIRVKGINLDRIEGGLIAEHWGEADTIGMLLQMGLEVFPPPLSRA